jgi:hypothetical protein
MHVQQTHAAAARSVLGGSGSTIWKPIAGSSQVYGASRVVQEGNAHLQARPAGGVCGSPRSHPAVLREQLFASPVELPQLWKAFPVPTYHVQAPIQAFYELYQVGVQP